MVLDVYCSVPNLLVRLLLSYFSSSDIMHDSPSLNDQVEASELLLLQRAIALNNAAVVHSSGGSPAFLQSGSSNDLQSLKKGLTLFHALLVHRDCGSSTANMLTKHEVSVSLGTPLAHLTLQLEDETTSTTRFASSLNVSAGSLHTENFSGFYIFSHPLVFDYSITTMMSNMGGRSPSSSTPRDDTSSASLVLSRSGGTRSICVLVGCTIFNMALLHHQQVVEECKSRRDRHALVNKSLKLYESAQVLLQRRLDELLETLRRLKSTHDASPPTKRVLLCTPGSLQEESKMVTLLLIATWNNMSQIHYFLENFAQSQFCLQRLLNLIGNTRSCRQRQYDRIATDLVNQVMLNVLLLRKNPYSRPAPAA